MSTQEIMVQYLNITEKMQLGVVISQSEKRKYFEVAWQYIFRIILPLPVFTYT